MHKYNLRNGDVISGAVLAALGTFIVIQGAIWPYYSPDGPGPGFFPVWYGVLMVALALWLMISAATKPKAEGDKKIFTVNTRRALTVWFGLVVCLVVMAWIGFTLAFGLFTMFIVSYVLGRSLIAGIVTAVATSAGFYVVFWELLGVQIPLGPWGF
jgi:putative tricarboxylic transport membrane protein